MYFGGGLTWHFPCSLWCLSTIEAINARFNILANIDAKFADQCRSFQEREFTLLTDRTVHQDIDYSHGVVIKPR